MTTMSLPRFRVLEGEAGKKPKKRKREKGSFPVWGIILLVVLVLLAGITAAALFVYHCQLYGYQCLCGG